MIEEERRSAPTMIAAPTRFAIERRFASSSPRPVGDDADLERALLELAQHVRRLARQPRQRVELRVEVGEEPVGLEATLRLDEHHLERLLLHQRDRVELRVEDARDRVGLRERLADEGEARRQRDRVLQGDPLQVGERLARTDAGERPPVEARQLAADVVHETRLLGRMSVSESPRIRSATSSARFCAMASRRSERPRRVSSSSRPSRPKSSSASRPSGVSRMFPRVRVGVVDALDDHLEHVRAEELPRELLRDPRRERRDPPRPSRPRCTRGRARSRSRTDG